MVGEGEGGKGVGDAIFACIIRVIKWSLFSL